MVQNNSSADVRIVGPGRRDSGKLMLYPDRTMIERALREIPAGTSLDRRTFREQLAHEAGAEVTCPVTTARVMRAIAADVSRELEAGAAHDSVLPFWRAVDPGSSEARSLPHGGEMIRQLRARESAS